MKNLAALFILCFAGFGASAQYIHKIKADSVLITNDSCNAELNLENSTRHVKGFLYNKGNGRTEFRLGLVKHNDSLWISGGDTLNIGSTSLFWKVLGNAGTNEATNFLGTTDSAKLLFKTFNRQRASIWANGVVNIGLNDTSSRPPFRFYPHGDFVSNARNNYNDSGSLYKNGIRYHGRLGYLEIGTSNFIDTTMSESKGIYQTSALILNTDSPNHLSGQVQNSIIAAYNVNLASDKSITYSLLSGGSFFSIGGLKHAIAGGNFHTLSGFINYSLIMGNSQQITRDDGSSGWFGALNSNYGRTYGNLTAGRVNSIGSVSQLTVGSYLVNRSYSATALGNSNVNFTSLPYNDFDSIIASSAHTIQPNYLLFSLGNSQSKTATTRSNALTVLYSGRTQVNTTGFSNNLSESDVTPKAALEVVSTNSGVLLPKLTNTLRNSIAGGDLHDGLLLYNTDTSKFQFYNGTTWKTIAEGPALTDGDKGDITVSSSGAAWTIDSNSVSDAKLRQSAGLSVIGNSTNSTANVADITAGTDDQVLRRSGTAIGFGAVNIASSNAVTGILPAANGGANYTVQSLTDGSTITWNVANGINGVVTLGGTGRTLSITNPVAGQTYTIRIIQDGTGSRTITTWPTNSKWPSGTTPTLSTVANRYDIVVFYYDGTNYYGTYQQNFQ